MRRLPQGKLNISYCDWGQTDDKIVRAVESGSNVIIWFSINLIKVNGLPAIQDKSHDYIAVQSIIERTKQINKDIVHLMSIGGWNSPHIDESFDCNVWFNTIDTWNKSLFVNNEELELFGFDGFDYDLEGNDDFNSPYNKFSFKQLNLMGELAINLKKEGYLVTMAPSQSYIDCEESIFSLDLRFSPSWVETSFPYHGKNVMAYIIRKYGHELFDFISIQLYEGWSRANNVLIKDEVCLAEYYLDLLTKMDKGWLVKFSSEVDCDIEDSIVSIPISKLVIGLANGWAGPSKGDKFMLLMPNELDSIYKKLEQANFTPLGFMFWNIKDEGIEVADRNGGKFKYFMNEIISSLYIIK